ncbi:MAG: ABC transporter ATP-binding protein [Lachnospiraceae bacterium]|nr:ABC transporter ATP-binding protein [Lachnospiraceae bacterium]
MMEKTILTFDHVTGQKRRISLQNYALRNFVLKDIHFALKAGYIYGLVGENGAGKTTLMNYILKENIPYEGQIYIEGTNIREKHAQIRNKIGFVSEENHFFEDCTGRQNAEILGAFYEHFDRKTFFEVMASMNVSAGKVYKSMSRGERLKFQLAFAIAHNPSLYLLDEVTAGMDPVFRIDFFHMLQKIIVDECACILMTSHISSEIETKTDYVGVMENGCLVTFGESLDVIQNLKKGRGRSI